MSCSAVAIGTLKVKHIFYIVYMSSGYGRMIIACYNYNGINITKTRLFKYIENFTSENIKFSDKKNWIFFIFLLKT